MDRVLEKFNLPRLNQEEIDIMNSPITSTEVKAVIKKSPKKQKPRTRWLHRRIQSNTERRANAYPSETLSKICRGWEHFQTHSTRPPSLLYQNQRRHKKRKHRPISLMNIEKSSTKFQRTEFSNTSKSSYIMIKLGLFHGCKISSTYANQSM